MFPTCVGMNRRQPGRHARHVGVPHVRGDEPAMTIGLGTMVVKLEAIRKPAESSSGAVSCYGCRIDSEVVTMDWQGRIVTDPDTLFGKPRIAGTRIGVDFVLDLLASGWTEAQILDSYPHLKPDDLQAVFAFVRDCMKNESFIMQSRPRSG